MKRIVTIAVFTLASGLALAQEGGGWNAPAPANGLKETLPPGSITPGTGGGSREAPGGNETIQPANRKPARRVAPTTSVDKPRAAGSDRWGSMEEGLDEVFGRRRILELVDRIAALEIRAGGSDLSAQDDLSATLHPKYQITTYDAKVLTKKAYVDSLKVNDLNFNIVRKDVTRVTRLEDGKVAVVTGSATLKGWKRPTEDGYEEFSVEILFTDVFVDVSRDPGDSGENRKWQCISSSQTLSRNLATTP